MTDAEKQLIREAATKHDVYVHVLDARHEPDEIPDSESLWRFFDEVIAGVNGLRFDAATKEFTSSLNRYEEWVLFDEGKLPVNGKMISNSLPPAVENEPYPTVVKIPGCPDLTICNDIANRECQQILANAETSDKLKRGGYTYDPKELRDRSKDVPRSKPVIKTRNYNVVGYPLPPEPKVGDHATVSWNGKVIRVVITKVQWGENDCIIETEKLSSPPPPVES